MWRSRNRTLFVVAAAWALAGAAGEDPDPVRAGLHAWAQPVARGLGLGLAVVLDLEPGWHVYFDGQNDSGDPVAVEWALPEGVLVSGPFWPCPKRSIQAGDLLDHVYEDRLVLLFEAQSPAPPPPEGWTLRARVRWMVCRELCRLGEALLVTQVGGRAPGPASLEAAPELARRAQADLPRTPGESSPFRLHWEREGVRIEVPDATRLVFHPRRGGSPLADLLRTGESSGPPLGLRWSPGSSAPRRLLGILEVHTGSPPVREAWVLDAKEPSSLQK
jgi:DsbC/DsbD-like thiol-disulfide interchange protein